MEEVIEKAKEHITEDWDSSMAYTVIACGYDYVSKEFEDWDSSMAYTVIACGYDYDYDMSLKSLKTD